MPSEVRFVWLATPPLQGIATGPRGRGSDCSEYRLWEGAEFPPRWLASFASRLWALLVSVAPVTGLAPIPPKQARAPYGVSSA